MSSRARKRHQRSDGSVGKKILLGLGLVLVVIGIAAAAAGGWVYDMWNDSGSVWDEKPIEPGENSIVYAADGSLLGYIDANIIREPVGLKSIPKTLQQATIAIEDENFYEHDGVDFSAIIRATVENVEAGEIEQGASTITQQLVRNLYIKKPEDTLERKLTEAKWSQEYEERFNKNEILEKYLNTATYGTNSGDTAVGVKSAATIYFNKDIEDINLGEAALLAGLPQAPSQYNPFTSPEAATKRRNLVLDAMLDQGLINQSEHDKWSKAGLGLERGYKYEQFKYRYFFDYVQQELIDRYGTATARVGGLEVHTTLVPNLQDTAEQAILNHPTTGAAAALVSTDAETGEIQAMASSSNYDDSEFNLAAQGKRQPGSSYKAFALTAAVEQGMDPDTTTYSAPSSIVINPCTGCPPWPVSGGGGGNMTLRNATANSVNTVFAQLVMDVGPEAMNDTAHKMGITSPTLDVPAEVLGAADVSVLEMSNAYATLANGGVHHDPTAISRVEFPNGDVEELDPSEGKRAFSDGVAYTVADVMKGALEYGTAAGQGIGCPASGKTGTTEAQSDAWFVGYTPHISTAVWVGNPNERIPLPGYGADLAAPIWQEYMLVAATKPCDDFPEPEDPVSLSSGSGSSLTDSDVIESTTDTTDPASPPSEDADGDGRPDDLYAPGVDPEIPGVEDDGGGGGDGPGGGVEP
ncbi:MAG TPA: transglycosylase domain-containing protein [Solirubrobacterales bacterium]|nr:transglycosylase domain-containing protein [Solirubrobacterales bacterium]